jgi:hypothetical protein
MSPERAPEPGLPRCDRSSFRQPGPRLLRSAKPLESVVRVRNRAGVTGASGRSALRVVRGRTMESLRGIVDYGLRVRLSMVGKDLHEPRLSLAAAHTADCAPLQLQPRRRERLAHRAACRSRPRTRNKSKHSDSHDCDHGNTHPCPPTHTGLPPHDDTRVAIVRRSARNLNHRWGDWIATARLRRLRQCTGMPPERWRAYRHLPAITSATAFAAGRRCRFAPYRLDGQLFKLNGSRLGECCAMNPELFGPTRRHKLLSLGRSRTGRSASLALVRCLAIPRCERQGERRRVH